MLRTFIAVPLPQAIVTELLNVQEKLRDDIPNPSSVRWVRPETMHLTLLFLGDTTEVRAATLSDALGQQADQLGFELRLGALGAFPNQRRPRVLWVGVAGQVAQLRVLQQAVAATVRATGQSFDDRRYNPHLTLGRVRKEASLTWPVAPPQVVSLRWRVDELVLYRSELKPAGVQYTRLATITPR